MVPTPRACLTPAERSVMAWEASIMADLARDDAAEARDAQILRAHGGSPMDDGIDHVAAAEREAMAAQAIAVALKALPVCR